MPSLELPRSLWLRGLDVVSLGSFAVLLGLAVWRLGPGPGWAELPGLALAALAGILAADLATGLIHWLGDRCFDTSTPLLGPSLIRPFREHHDDPLAITRHGFAEVMGNNALFLLPVVSLAGMLAPAFGRDPTRSHLLVFLVVLALVALASNPIHRWAHMRRPPAAIRWLQRRGWILSPRHHARHHDGHFDRCFCVATGWMNPLLDRLGWLRAGEHDAAHRSGARHRPARRGEAGLGRL